MTSTPTALLPDDETERLRSLRHYDILHSLQEDVFDELVTLAARIFNLPISLIALVDEHEVSYKALHGLAHMLPQPREEQLCSMVIKEDKAVVYKDLTATAQDSIDAAAIRNALAKEARFYAAAPLRMPDQRNIGALCVADMQPRDFSPEEREVLECIAGLVSQAIVVRYLCRSNPSLGEARWHTLRGQIREEVFGLVALVRYLVTRYGSYVPVPQMILQPVMRRLNDLCTVLEEYRQESI